MILSRRREEIEAVEVPGGVYQELLLEIEHHQEEGEEK